MEDHNVLEHLLGLENEAAVMVNNAQVEAERRLAEREKQNRAHYDEAYAHEAETLETAYQQKIAAVKGDYQKELEDYRTGLETQPVDTKAFFILMEKFLLVKDA